MSQTSPWQRCRQAPSAASRKKTSRPLDLRSMRVQRSQIHHGMCLTSDFPLSWASRAVCVCENRSLQECVQRPAMLIKLIIAIMLLFPEPIRRRSSETAFQLQNSGFIAMRGEDT